MSSTKYPRWIYYPRWSEPPAWVSKLIEIFREHKAKIDSNLFHIKSDEALAIIRKDLEKNGFVVEGSKTQATIRRPVHFGEYGAPDREYQIDAYHPQWKVGLEIEAGRSIRGNAIYRDIIQTSLLVGVDYFVLSVPQKYSFQAKGKAITDQTYEMCMLIFDAIYSSERLRLPLSGVLLIGY